MSDLLRLAHPVPAKYVKPPAKGKYGSYVPHEIINQILLGVVGPFDFKVEQIVYGPEGLVEGITASMTLTVDGRSVTVTEVGDCEIPTNWKTQGARMKDAASDALKRCAMRFGCGLHLWAGDSYFLYSQLQKSSGPELQASPSQHGVSSGPEQNAEAARGSERAERTPHADHEPPASALSVEVAPAASTSPEGSSTRTSPTVGDLSGPSANQLQHAKSRVSALLAAKVKVADEREKRLLPPLKAGIGYDEFALWLVMLSALEASLVSA